MLLDLIDSVDHRSFKQPSTEEVDYGCTNHEDHLGETSDITKHLQDGVDLPLVDRIVIINSNVPRAIVTVEVVIVWSDICHLHEVVCIRLPQLKVVILETSLLLLYEQVGILGLSMIDFEEQPVIYEELYLLVVVSEVKVGIHEGYAVSLSIKVGVDHINRLARVIVL
jgi:hypothetical protein